MKICLVTGSSGLIGSEVSTYFHERDFAVHGVDNNQREVFFGPQGNNPLERAAAPKVAPPLYPPRIGYPQSDRSAPTHRNPQARRHHPYRRAAVPRPWPQKFPSMIFDVKRRWHTQPARSRTALLSRGAVHPHVHQTRFMATGPTPSS